MNYKDYRFKYLETRLMKCPQRKKKCFGKCVRNSYYLSVKAEL